MQNLFKDGRVIIETIESHGEEAYFVGGCVRDFLSERPIGDIDIATSASPEHIQQMFASVIPVGIEHGTVIVRYQKQSFEVTTFRLEGTYSDHRRPDEVKFIGQINEDLKRRDFTINALAMDKHGQITDLFEGQEDLKAGLIRTVGNGYDRFQEDPLRIIRALRFASQLGFDIESETLSYMISVKKEIDNISIERITNEFAKFFAGSHVNKGIHYLQQTKIYKHLPIISDYPYVIERFPHLDTPLSSFGQVIACFYYLEPSVSINDWCLAWKCSNAIKREAIALIEAVKRYNKEGLTHWLVYQLSEAYYDGFTRIIQSLDQDMDDLKASIHKISEQLPIRSAKDLEITGHDILSLFPNKHKGPWIGQLLHHIEHEVVSQRLPNKLSHLKEWIICNPPVVN